MIKQLSGGLLLLAWLGLASLAWAQTETAPATPATLTSAPEVAAPNQAPASSATTPAPATPAAPYVQKDRTTFFIIGGLINVLALVVFLFWAIRQWRLKNRQP